MDKFKMVVMGIGLSVPSFLAINYANIVVVDFQEDVPTPDPKILIRDVYIPEIKEIKYLRDYSMRTKDYYGKGSALTFGTNLPTSVKQRIGELSYSFSSKTHTKVTHKNTKLFSQTSHNRVGQHHLRVRKFMSK